MWSGGPASRFPAAQGSKVGYCTELAILLSNNLPSVAQQNRIVCQQTFDDSMHKCHVCGSGFMSQNQLLYHVKARHSSRRFVCPQCQRTFVSRGGMNEHIKHVHQKLARYLCETCGKGYSIRSNYLDHVATHTGVKRNVCSICQRQFTFRHSLKEHIIREHPTWTVH